MIGKIIKLMAISVTLASFILLPNLNNHRLQAETLNELKQKAIEENRVPFVPSVSIPGSSDFKKDVPYTSESGNYLGEYIRDVYKFLVGIAGIAATIMIAAGGIVWLFSSGNSSRISQAKEMITGAIIGLVLALGSYLILFNINSNLVHFNLPIKEVDFTGYCVCQTINSRYQTVIENFCFLSGPDVCRKRGTETEATNDSQGNFFVKKYICTYYEHLSENQIGSLCGE